MMHFTEKPYSNRVKRGKSPLLAFLTSGMAALVLAQSVGAGAMADDILNTDIADSSVRGIPFTTDTQVRLLGLFEAQTNRQIVHVGEGTPKESETYLAIENVPLKNLLHLLARRSGLNYLEPADDVPGLDEQVSLEMREPKPKELLEWLLKHRNLELYDADTGVYTVRQYTNQLSFYRFKLTDNFIDRFKGSAQSQGGSTGGYGAYGGAGGNAVSASQSFSVENGGKYGDIEGLLEKVANAGDEKGSKVWYYDEKQAILLYGTRQASERVTKYLEIANIKNPNIRIDVRIYSTASNPQSQLGVDWSKMLSPGLTFGLQPPGSPGGNAGANGTNGTFSTFNSLASLGKAFGDPLGAIVLQNDLRATLNFFVKESRAEAVTEPSTITANDREVAFAATQQIPYVSGSSSYGGLNSGGANGYDNTSFINVGATIRISLYTAPASLST